MSNPTRIRILRIESVLVRWITSRSPHYPLSKSEWPGEKGEWRLLDQGFGSAGVLYVQDGTISWNSPMIKIERGRDNFSNLWGIWKKRFVLLECGSCISGKNDWIKFTSRVVHQVLLKTNTKSIKLFGEI
jgi:hypothetical protein